MSPQNKPWNTRHLTRCALLTAIALTIFMIESQIPLPLPVPGIKLGLANIVTVYAVFTLGPGSALLILISRIFLASVFSGRMIMVLYSLGGGLLSWMALVGLRRVLSPNEIWLSSAIAAIFHNLGQMLVAAWVMGSWVVLAYLPYLILGGIAAGLFTGICAQMLIKRLPPK